MPAHATSRIKGTNIHDSFLKKKKIHYQPLERRQDQREKRPSFSIAKKRKESSTLSSRNRIFIFTDSTQPRKKKRPLALQPAAGKEGGSCGKIKSIYQLFTKKKKKETLQSAHFWSAGERKGNKTPKSKERGRASLTFNSEG